MEALNSVLIEGKIEGEIALSLPAKTVSFTLVSPSAEHGNVTVQAIAHGRLAEQLVKLQPIVTGVRVVGRLVSQGAPKGYPDVQILAEYIEVKPEKLSPRSERLAYGV